MFWLLMKVRLMGARNSVRDTWSKHPVFVTGISVVYIVLFALMFAGFRVFFGIAATAGVLGESIYQVSYFLFLFLLAGAVPFVAGTLLQSGDYALLFASPVSPRAVIAAKLLDATVTNSLQFTVLGIPALLASAAALGIGPMGWPLVMLLVCLFILLPAIITALALLVLLALLGMRRIRAAITTLNIAMAAGICVIAVSEIGRLPITSFAMRAGVQLGPALAAPSLPAHLLPSAWFAKAFLAAAPGPEYSPLSCFIMTLLILAVCAGITVCGTFMGSRLLSAATLAEDQGGTQARDHQAGNAACSILSRLLGSDIAAILQKDLKYLLRDNLLLSQLGMPLILFCVPFLLGLRMPSGSERQEMWPFASGMVGIILFMHTSILSLTSLGMEGQGYWMVMTSPNRPASALVAKFVFSTAISAIVAVILTLLSSVAFGIPAYILLAQLVISVLMAVGLCGIGVGISGAFPRFIYENPAHRVSAWALILGFFASSAYVFIATLILGGGWIASTMLPERAPVAIGVAAVLFTLTSVGSAAGSMLIGAQRIGRYQWEH